MELHPHRRSRVYLQPRRSKPGTCREKQSGLRRVLRPALFVTNILRLESGWMRRAMRGVFSRRPAKPWLADSRCAGRSDAHRFACCARSRAPWKPRVPNSMLRLVRRASDQSVGREIPLSRPIRRSMCRVAIAADVRWRSRSNRPLYRQRTRRMRIVVRHDWRLIRSSWILDRACGHIRVAS